MATLEDYSNIIGFLLSMSFHFVGLRVRTKSGTVKLGQTESYRNRIYEGKYLSNSRLDIIMSKILYAAPLATLSVRILFTISITQQYSMQNFVDQFK